MKLHLTLAAALCLLAVPALAGPGAKYGTRDPATCADASQPKSGAPNAAQAAKYLACDQEKESGDQLYLITNAKVQVAGGSRRYNPNHDAGTAVDEKKPVYDIRGSFDHYSCSPLSSYSAKTNPGKTCAVSHETNASGTCYHDNFGDWHCTMIDVMHLHFDEDHVPAPK